MAILLDDDLVGQKRRTVFLEGEEARRRLRASVRGLVVREDRRLRRRPGRVGKRVARGRDAGRVIKGAAGRGAVAVDRLEEAQ